MIVRCHSSSSPTPPQTPARHPRSLTFLHRPARVLPHSAQLDPPLTSSVPSSFLLVLACSSMGFSTSKLYNDRVYKFVTLFFLVLPLTFLIVAASLHNLYSFNAADFDIPDDTLTGSAHVGAFYACVDLDGVMEEYQGFSNVAFSIHHCLRIRSDCTAHFYYDTSVGPGELDTGLGPDWNCSQYNAFRAFLILAILFVGFALLTASLSLLYLPQSRLLLWLTVGFNSFAVVSSIISWGLVADHWKTINDSNGGDWFKTWTCIRPRRHCLRAHGSGAHTVRAGVAYRECGVQQERWQTRGAQIDTADGRI